MLTAHGLESAPLCEPAVRGGTVVDIMQALERCDENELDGYLRNHDHVILFNAETPPNIRDLASGFDHPHVTLVTTGHMNFGFQHARVIEFENFFAVMQQHYSPQWLGPELERLRPYDTKPQAFDALLGLVKPHRSYVYQQIKQWRPSMFLTTYYGDGPIVPNGDFMMPRGVSVSGDIWRSSWEVQYRGANVRLSHVIPTDIYNITAYSLVTETYHSNNFCFFTEKTAKCFLARRLFVMFAGQYYLKTLRSLGFQTFSSVIDESYDEEPDAELRWLKAWAQVQYLCDQDQQQVLTKIRDVLEHNFARITTGAWNFDRHLHTVFGAVGQVK